MYRVRHKKSNPLGLLAVFSATAGNFNAKFYTLIYLSCTYMQVSTALSNTVLKLLALQECHLASLAHSKTFEQTYSKVALIKQ